MSAPKGALFVTQFRPAQASDLAAIMAIETAGFSPAEAATKSSMQARIAAYPETFIVAVVADQVLGYIVGPAIDQRYLTDELFASATANAAVAPYQAVLSLAVAPNRRGQGLGGQLLAQLAQVAAAQHRRAVTLTCLKRLVPFYAAHGFRNEGQSASSHAGEVWYNMVKPLG